MSSPEFVASVRQLELRYAFQLASMPIAETNLRRMYVAILAFLRVYLQSEDATLRRSRIS